MSGCTRGAPYSDAQPRSPLCTQASRWARVGGLGGGSGGGSSGSSSCSSGSSTCGTCSSEGAAQCHGCAHPDTATHAARVACKPVVVVFAGNLHKSEQQQLLDQLLNTGRFWTTQSHPFSRRLCSGRHTLQSKMQATETYRGVAVRAIGGWRWGPAHGEAEAHRSMPAALLLSSSGGCDDVLCRQHTATAAAKHSSYGGEGGGLGGGEGEGGSGGGDGPGGGQSGRPEAGG